MKKNSLLLLMICSLGFYGPFVMAYDAPVQTDTTIYDNDPNANDAWSSGEGAEEGEGIEVADAYLEGTGGSGTGSTGSDSQTSNNTFSAATVDTSVTESATQAGGSFEGLPSADGSVEENYDDPSETVDSSEVAEDSGDEFYDDPNETTDVSEEQLAEEAKIKIQNAIANGNVGLAIVEWFKNAFSAETWEEIGETIRSAIVDAFKSIDGAATQLAQELQNEATALKITSAATGLGNTMGNFILDIFNDICNIANGTTGANYIDTPSYNTYKASIDAGMTIAEAGQAVSEAATSTANAVSTVTTSVVNGITETLL